MRRDLILLPLAADGPGERDAGDGRVQVAVIVSPSTARGIAAVNAASPGRDDCPVEIAADRLTDCDGRTWTFEGHADRLRRPSLLEFPDRGGRDRSGSVDTRPDRAATD